MEKMSYFLTEVYRRPSIIVAEQLAKTRITPNQLSFLSIVSGAIACLFLSTGTYSYLLIGAFFTHLALFFDYLDGPVAKLKNMQTKLGEWVDLTCSNLADFLILLGIIIASYQQNPHVCVWIFGTITMGIRFMLKNMQAMLKTIDCWEKMVDYGMSKHFLKNFFYTRHFIYYGVAVFCLLNRPYWFLVVATFYGTLFYLSATMMAYWKILKKSSTR